MNKEDNTPKGDLEKLIKTVFERDFNDLSFRQLGEIAEIIVSCSECPITGCDEYGCCRIAFENALRKDSENV